MFKIPTVTVTEDPATLLCNIHLESVVLSSLGTYNVTEQVYLGLTTPPFDPLIRNISSYMAFAKP